MLSVGAIRFEDRFCASKKGGIGGGEIGGGGRVSARGAMHMAAALASCRKALVGTGLSISLLFDTVRGAVHMAAALAGCRKALVGTGFSIYLLFDTSGCR